MGCQPVAEPIYTNVLAADDRARRTGLDGGAHDRRSRLAGAIGRSEGHCRLLEGPRLRTRCIQGAEADIARLEPAAAPTCSACGRPHHRVGVATGRIPPPILRARHVGLRPSRDQMPDEMNVGRDTAMLNRMALTICFALAPAVEAGAYTAYVSNEKGNTI